MRSDTQNALKPYGNRASCERKGEVYETLNRGVILWPDKQTKGGCLRIADNLTAHFALHPALRDREEGESLERNRTGNIGS